MKGSEKMQDKKTIKWLLQGDPAIVYQTHRLLLKTDEKTLEEYQEAIPEKGWGKKFLSYRDKKTGLWAEGLYSPKWLSTTYSMLELRNFGIAPDYPAYVESAKVLLDGLWIIPTKKNQKYLDLCICGMLLHLCCYSHVRSPKINEIIDFILATHMKDGGWNCRTWENPHHSSLHTTINVLEGLQTYLDVGYDYQKEALEVAMDKAHDFILCHRLFQSDKTGKTIDKKMLMLSYPSRWRYDILRCLVYFVDRDMPYDERMADAINHIKKKQKKDGCWPVQQKYTGLVYFDMEKTGGPSRWNTLRVLRVLERYKEFL